MSDTTDTTTSNEIVVNFCPLFLGEAESKEPDEPSASLPKDADEKTELTVWFKEEGEPAIGTIEITLYREDVCSCLEDNTDDWIKWERQVIESSQKSQDNVPDELKDKTEKDIELKPLPTVTIVIPNSCLWKASQVTIILPRDDNRNYYNVIPDEDDDLCLIGGGYDRDIWENQPVPGCKLQLKTYLDTDPTSVCSPVFKWYGTGCLTGGRVVKVNGKYGDLDITYDVEVQDLTIPKVHPTDFVRWEPGDWVFLCHDDCTDACDKKKAECRTAFEQGFNDVKSAYDAMAEEKKKPHTSDEYAAIDKAYEKKKEDICKEIAKHLRILPMRIGVDGA